MGKASTNLVSASPMPLASEGLKPKKPAFTLHGQLFLHDAVDSGTALDTEWAAKFVPIRLAQSVIPSIDTVRDQL